MKTTKKTKLVLLAMLAAATLSSCTVSQATADAYNNLVDVGGTLLSEEDAAKLALADSLITSVVKVETAETEAEAE